MEHLAGKGVGWVVSEASMGHTGGLRVFGEESRLGKGTAGAESVIVDCELVDMLGARGESSGWWW